MRRIAPFLLVLMMTLPVTAERIGTIDEVLKPQMIKVVDDELFVAEGHYIYIYSLPDLTLKHKIGKEGEGPGEFKLDPSRTIIFTVHPGFILAESRNKIIYFNRRGEFIKEQRKTPGILQTIPLGRNLAVLRILYGPEAENYFAVSVMSPDFKEIREVYRQKFFTFKGRIHVIPDGLNLCVVDDKLVVEESPDGFVIEIFDSEARKIRRIEKPFQKVAVTAGHRQEAFNDLLKIPSIRRSIDQQGRTQVVNNLQRDALYPEYLAPIEYIMADHDRIYIKTPAEKGDGAEFQVMDLNGRILKTLTLPRARKVDFLVRMQGDKNYFTIHHNRYYYLRMDDSQEDETWELHMEKIQ